MNNQQLAYVKDSVDEAKILSQTNAIEQAFFKHKLTVFKKNEIKDLLL